MSASIRISGLFVWVVLVLGGVGCGLQPSSPSGPIEIDTPPAGVAGAALSEGMSELLPETLVDANGEEVGAEVLAGKLVGLYFSAQWCPPCRAFTPSLVEFRDRNHEDFEVVFVSSDRTQEAQFTYMRTYGMQWPAVPYGPELAPLGERYGVQGIPTLVILGPDGRTLTATGRADVQADPSGAIAKWRAAAGSG